jgi:hypothetical protein
MPEQMPLDLRRAAEISPLQRLGLEALFEQAAVFNLDGRDVGQVRQYLEGFPG